jgi:hypothetical protein
LRFLRADSIPAASTILFKCITFRITLPFQGVPKADGGLPIRARERGQVLLL